MTESMTGYGSGERPLEGTALAVEVRSVNHRYLEVSVRGPRWSLPLEREVRQAIKNRFSRGRFDVFIHLGKGGNEGARLDPAAARDLVASLRVLQEELALPGEVDMTVLSQFRDALRGGEPTQGMEVLREPVLGALEDALGALATMRHREGEALERDIQAHLQEVDRLTAEVRTRVPEAREDLAARTRERLEKFAEGLSLDEGRLEQELVYAAERGDISEEISRLESHIVQFRAALAASEPVGRRMDFLLQEMNREVNTIASKSGDLLLTQRAVELKSALEKIREQVQNIE